MNKEKEIKENYPIYPLSIALSRKLSVRIGSRNFYADIPYQVYHFMMHQVEKAVNGIKVTKNTVRKEWDEFVQKYKLTVHGKPIAKVYLMYQPFAGGNFLILKVYWSQLIKYLELKAKEALWKIIKEGENAMKDFYENLWLNFFMIGGKAVEPTEFFITSEMKKVKKLLEIIGDYQEMSNAIDKLVDIIKDLNKLRRSIRPIELYVTMLTFYVRNVRKAIEHVNPQLTYLLLRTILEHLVKFIVYLNTGRELRRPDLILFFTFFNEYKTERREYRIKKFINEFKINIGEYLEEELLNKLVEMHVPRLMVNSNTLEEFADIYGLGDVKKELSNVYSACSWVVHNRPTLPYYSLLELKLLKHFIIRYVELITKVINAVASNTLCKLTQRA